MSKLRAKQTRLRNLLTSFNVIYSFMEQYEDTTQSGELASRLEKLEPLWEKINEAMTEVELVDSEEGAVGERYVKERIEFQNKFYRLKGFLVSKLRDNSEQTGALHVSQALESTITFPHPHVKLPLISLPKFSGNVEEWLAFRDLFVSLIHCSAELPDIEKFHYLRSQLEGEALAMISSLPLTQVNYKVAWELLDKRYSNSKCLKKKQVQTLFDQSVMKRESVAELHKLVEAFERATKVLDQVTKPADYKELLLVHLLGSRLDDKTRRSWEEHSSMLEEESFKDMLDFLHRRILVLESLPNKPTAEIQPPTVRKVYPSRIASNGLTQSNHYKCISCSASHPLYTCPVFERLSVSDREGLLRQHSLCRNCFRKGHMARECTSKFSCRRCKERHHTLVCYKQERRKDEQDGSSNIKSTMEAIPNAAEKVATASITSRQIASSNVGRSGTRILLATAVVRVIDDYGNEILARALLDSGSECNIISTKLSQRLRVKTHKADVQISGVGQNPTKTRERLIAKVKSRLTDYSQDMEFYVLSKITEDLPTSIIKAGEWDLPVGIHLADPEFFKTNVIDLLLGGEFFFDFFPTKQRVSLGRELPTLVESVFGWLVTGRCGWSQGAALTICQHSVVSEPMEQLMSKFWECEEGLSPSTYSVEETKCEQNFVETVRRGDDGRYTVGLPKSQDYFTQLGESKATAHRRLMLLERRLERDKVLKEEYHTFMRDYVDRGHMQKLNESPTDAIGTYYLPHHPVVKDTSTTTRVRVVFDASSKTSTGASLNDTLLNGPIIQDDLRSIILRSRVYPIVLVADVEKMFRQIRMDAADLPLQRILWRFSPEQPVDTYELLTVTYGTKPAPFLATRTLMQLSLDEATNFPLASERMVKDVYMDDVITGARDVKEARIIRFQLDEMLRKGGFRLRKWVSNNDEALDGISEENLALPLGKGIDFDGERTVKTLGLVWEPESDTFRFKIAFVFLPDAELTKRKVLSCIAKVFDPLGLVGPVVTKAKIFMQQIWQLKNEEQRPLGWDDMLPPVLVTSWKEFYHQLPKLDEIRIPRCVSRLGAVSFQLHTFCDASEKAYGACTYLRSQRSENQVTITLLSSRSRVAPLQRQTIPRLELCGARLATELHRKVVKSIAIRCESYFWTDSKTVLQWLAQPPNTWSTFVAHRVSFIQHNTQNCRWNHVPGVLNPSDQLSRGIDPEQIASESSWWNGPAWLMKEQDDWPKLQDPTVHLVDTETERRSTLAMVAAPVEPISDRIFSMFSDYTNLLRVTAYCKRFIHNLRATKPARACSTPLTTLELRDAEISLVRLMQQEVFSREMKRLSKNEPVDRGSRLRWFNPTLTSQGVIRVGGRLAKSELPDEAKHPMIIDGNHQFAKLLAVSYHKKLLHAAPQFLLSSIRLRFWPLGGRSLCRLTVHRCITCYRMKPKLQQQFMAQLPAPRIKAARPFLITGVDYFGPVHIRQGYRRSSTKAYVAVFICFCTKAVHLELVSDLSTSKFIQALRRFTARRGKCSDMYSDNGTNFVGARNVLAELLRSLKSRLHHEEIQKECSNDGINWHFNPPAAPHFGGLWEAAVRSAKKHLLRVLGNSSVSYEDFTTLLVQVEGCLNSRPLTQLSDDPTDLQPLTPAHFLVGSSLQALPDNNYGTIPTSRLSQWQRVQQQLQHFWRRWHTEYLAQLQARVKNWKPAIKFEPGRLVIIVDENQPSMKWKMARIHQVHPSDDGIVRVVTLRTATGYLKRPVTKICLLPQATEDALMDSDQPSHPTEIA